MDWEPSPLMAQNYFDFSDLRGSSRQKPRWLTQIPGWQEEKSTRRACLPSPTSSACRVSFSTFSSNSFLSKNSLVRLRDISMAWCSLLCNITTQEVLSKDDRYRKRGRQLFLQQNSRTIQELGSALLMTQIFRILVPKRQGRTSSFSPAKRPDTPGPKSHPTVTKKTSLDLAWLLFVGLWCLVTQLLSDSLRSHGL